MICIGDILRPADVNLQLAVTDRESAIDAIGSLLQHHERVLDWPALRAGLHAAAPCLGEANAAFAVLLPHTRTDAVTGMVMSVGRLQTGFRCEGCDQPVRYVFCIAVPRAMAADYLRLVGLLARLLRDRGTESELFHAAAAEDFVRTLSRLEARL